MPLPLGKRVAVLTLKESRNRLVQGVFVIRGLEGPRDCVTLGVADVFRDLIAERALAETSQPLTERVQVAAGAGILRPKRIYVAEQMLVNQRRQPVQFQQRILEGRSRQQQFAARLGSPADGLPDSVAGPVSIVGHITRDELRRQISDVDMANGLANRFLWRCVRRSKCLPEGGSLLDRALEPLIDRLVAAVEFAQGVGVVKRDDEAREIWRNVYPELSEGKPGLLGAATSRAEAQVMRLAMLYALLDQSDLIGADHLTAALAFWTYAEQSARYIFGSALGDPTADEILAELRRCSPNGMTRDAIRERFHRNKPSAEISRALAVLYEYHLVRFAKNNETGGRPAEVWYASL